MTGLNKRDMSLFYLVKFAVEKVVNRIITVKEDVQ